MRSRGRRAANDGGTHNACPSGNLAHTSRRDAKVHAVRHRGGHVRPYRCDDCGLWHIGYLPVQVRRGLESADEHYGRAAS